jgi:hypothetical protein
MERRRDLLETLNTIAGIAKALESKLKPQTPSVQTQIAQ